MATQSTTTDGRRSHATAPMRTYPYRLVIDGSDLEAGAPIRVACAQSWVGGRGYVDFAFIWTARPSGRIYTQHTADRVIEAERFDRLVAAGAVVEEGDWKEPAEREREGISKAKAELLHRRLSAAGYASSRHYEVCEKRYARPLDSLTGLTEVEAKDLHSMLDGGV